MPAVRPLTPPSGGRLDREDGVLADEGSPVPLHAWSSCDPRESAGRPVLVLLHGRGADETSLAVLADALPDGLVFTAPRGPHPEGAGYAWFAMHAIGHPVAESLAAARTGLLDWLDATWAHAGGVALLGFSDGALLAGDVLLAAPDRFEAAVLLGGALPWSTDPPRCDGRLAGRRVLHGYGADDDVVPRDLLDRTATWLWERSGANVEVQVQAGLAHAVSTEQVAHASRFLQRWLRARA